MPTLKGTEVSLSYPFLVSCIFFNKCLYFSYYVAGYLLDRPRVLFFTLIKNILIPIICRNNNVLGDEIQ